VSQTVPLGCRCGEVTGHVTNASPATSNRILCYCADCQAYAHWLGRSDLLDEHGGSDLVQIAPATLALERGKDQIRGFRLSPKGLYRWYALCCKTPVGNTMTPGIPFVGLPASVFGDAADAAFGTPIGGVHGKCAIGTPPPGSDKVDVKLLLHCARRFVAWKLGRQTWPHPFFDRSGTPSHHVTTLSRAEREALRPLCGPAPAAAST
jgi:hypothetical protein